MKIDKARRLITDVDKGLDKALGATTSLVPALIITKHGNVRCPWCKKKVSADGVINLDCAIRWNRGEFVSDTDGGRFIFSDGEKNFDTFGYMTECCMALVAIPEGIEEVWV